MMSTLVNPHRHHSFTPRYLGIALSLLAAAAAAVFAAHAGLDRAVIAWRAVVSLISVAAFQFSVLAVWEISGPGPLSTGGNQGDALRKRPPASE